MKIMHITVSENSLTEILKPKLLGHVFHVTSHEVAKRALEGEGLLTNENGNLASGFSSSRNGCNGFFKSKGCVSLFDFRNPTDEGLDRAICWANALNPSGHAKNNPAFLFIDPSCYDELIPYTLQAEEQAWDKMIVPYVECGHKGSISSKMITAAIFVTVIPTSSYLLDAVEKPMLILPDPATSAG